MSSAITGGVFGIVIGPGRRGDGAVDWGSPAHSIQMELLRDAPSQNPVGKI